jgi:hypothetical protein
MNAAPVVWVGSYVWAYSLLWVGVYVGATRPQPVLPALQSYFLQMHAMGVECGFSSTIAFGDCLSASFLSNTNPVQ